MTYCPWQLCMHLPRYVGNVPHIVLEHGQRSDGPRCVLFSCWRVGDGECCHLPYRLLISFSYENTDRIGMSIGGRRRSLADFLYRRLIDASFQLSAPRVHRIIKLYWCPVFSSDCVNFLFRDGVKTVVWSSTFVAWSSTLRNSHSLAFAPTNFTGSPSFVSKN